MNGSYTGRIFDMSGRRIFAQSTDSGALAVDHLHPGMYMLEVEQNGRIDTWRFLKQ
jgi:hypothetical protein